MEEWLLYFVLAGITTLLLLGIKFLRRTGNEKNGEVQQRNAPARENVRAGAPNRRVAAVRNRRAQGRRPVEDSESDLEEHGQGEVQAEPTATEEAMLNDPKLGAKKRAKLEAKLEKRAQREAEERQREEKKKRDAKEEEEKQRKELEEKDEEKRRIEEENRLREEAAQRELEAYLKMKETFVVEEEGCEVNNEEEEQNLLENFVTHVKDKKVILFEELATKFGLKVPDAINRLTSLVESGRLTGVMDDRGKFIYISEDELSKFAKFIKQRGRVSIVELVENSNQVINIAGDAPAIGSSSHVLF